jgi:hypothetical protein
MREDNNSQVNFPDAGHTANCRGPDSPSPKKSRKRTLLASHSGTLTILGLILTGFVIALLHGGFPSILLPTFLILAIGLLGDLFKFVGKSAPKRDTEPVNLLRGIFIVVSFYFIVEWMGGALLGCFENPNFFGRILRKVEFPFSEASHVVVDSKDSVYVYSQFNKRIQKYSKDGRFQFGWFSGGWKHNEVAVDEDNFIYTYSGIARKYDTSGNLLHTTRRRFNGGGWWRFSQGSVVWDPNAEEPRKYDLYEPDPVQYGDVYNPPVKEGDLMPAFELRKSGFKTPDGKYYKLVRLWFLFPVVSVERDLSEFEGYIMPNPLSLAVTFVFPGFFFYVLALIMTWVFQKKQERFTKRGLIYILTTTAIFVLTAAAVIIGGGVVVCIANALPKDNPLHFWLVPIIVIPYWFVVGVTAMYCWQIVRRRFSKANQPENGNLR